MLCATFFSLLVVLLGCAHNPVGGNFRDGRILLTIDIPVGSAGHAAPGLLHIHTKVEGYDEMFVTKVFDYRREQNARARGIDFEGAWNWAEIHGRPTDFLGMMIKGGSEVTVQVLDDAVYRGHESLTFKMDGNTGLRSYMTENGRYELERLY